MSVTSADEIVFYQKCLNLGKRIDGRLNNQIRNFELSSGDHVVRTSNGSSRLHMAEENFTVLVGIKADVINLVPESADHSRVKLNICSSISKNQSSLEKEYLEKLIEEITYYFQGTIDQYTASSSLVLIEKKLAWNIYVDVYINGYLGYCNIDHLSYAIRAALNSCSLPALEISLNSVSNEYSFTVKDETIRPFQNIVIPHLLVGGFHRGQIYLDLTARESFACEALFLAAVHANGDVSQLRKIGKT